MSRFGLVVFDWEGTLGDPLGSMLKLVLAQAKKMGLPTVDGAFARQSLALGLELGIHRLFPSLSLHQYEGLLNGIQQSMRVIGTDAALFEGAKPLLEALRDTNVLLAVATNRGTASLQKALKATELTDYFSAIRTASQVPPKPCPQMLEEIMEELHVAPFDTLMIGDSVTDIEMALLAQVEAIGVDFYHQQADDLRTAGATAVFDDFAQVGRYLKLSGY